ncbi:unnamed protein product, partial [Callosobruchus maculatus]
VLTFDEIELISNYDVQFAKNIQQQQQEQLHDLPPPPPPKKQGFSQGSGLRNIAEGSSRAAKDAVNNQDAAGHQAAYVAKNTLAQSAAAASATAQAALAGKQILLQGLEQQLRDAKQALMGEQQQLMQ